MDRRNFLTLGAAAGAIAAAPDAAAATTTPPRLGFHADRRALLAELALVELLLAQERPPSPDEPPHPEVTLSPGAFGCRIFAAAADTRFHSTVEAECTGAGAVTVPLLDLRRWLSAGREETVTVRAFESNRIEAECGGRVTGFPARPADFPEPDIPSPSAFTAPPDPLARYLDFVSRERYGLDHSGPPRISDPAAREHFARQASRARPTVYPFPTNATLIPLWRNPAGRRAARSVRKDEFVTLRLETLIQALALEETLERRVRLHQDGIRIFVECEKRLLASSTGASASSTGAPDLSTSTIIEHLAFIRSGPDRLVIGAASPA